MEEYKNMLKSNSIFIKQLAFAKSETGGVGCRGLSGHYYKAS